MLDSKRRFIVEVGEVIEIMGFGNCKIVGYVNDMVIFEQVVANAY